MINSPIYGPIDSDLCNAYIKRHKTYAFYCLLLCLLCLGITGYLILFTAYSAYLLLAVGGLNLLGAHMHNKFADMWEDLLVEVKKQEQKNQTINDLNPHKK